jgi:TonB family protein
VTPGGTAAKSSGVEVAGPGAGEGGGTVLAQYLTLIDWKIQGNWVPAAAGGESEAVVIIRFRVLRTGQVKDLGLEKSSGNASADSAAMRAVRQSLPFPPFPNLLTEPLLDLRYRFVMERG